MSRENLIRHLQRLRDEISHAARSNPEAYQKLDTLINDLEDRVADTIGPDDSLAEQIRNEITYFEATHPRATAILNDILVTLSNMGI